MDVSATFTGPNNSSITIPGYYTKNKTWVVRFSPPSDGTWTYKTTSTDTDLDGKTGIFLSVPNTNPNIRGALVIDPANPTLFKHEDGTPYFMLGYELDMLANLSIGDPSISKTKTLIDNISSNGFSDVIMAVYAEDGPWGDRGKTTSYGPDADFGPPAEMPWPIVSGKFVISQPNPAYWENLDRVIDYLHNKGMSIHLYTRMQPNKYFAAKLPSPGTADEAAFIKYVVARYQAYSSVIFDYQKEVANVSMTDATVQAGVANIKKNLAYPRLISVHDADSYSRSALYNRNIDFYTDQGHAGDHYQETIAGKAIRNWPYYNAEHSYQIGNAEAPNRITFPGATGSPESVFDATLEIAMAGGFSAYYYGLHAWDIMTWQVIPLHLDYYRNFTNFIKNTKWYTMTPSDSLIGGGGSKKHCLADAGKEYIVLLGTNQNSATLSVAGVPAGASLSGTWVNLYNGANVSVANVGNGSLALTKPSAFGSAPAMLSLKR